MASPDWPGLNPALDPLLLSRIEDAGLNASAPPQQLWLDGWLVRLSPGKAKRARCVNAVAAGRTPLRDKIAACQVAFDRAALPMIVRITPFNLPAELDATLAESGFRRFDNTRVMVLESLENLPQLACDEAVISPVGLEAFAQRVGGFRGSPLRERQAHAHRLAHAPVPFHAFEMRIDGVVVGCGQFAVEGDLVGLYDVFTAESARRRGAASALCAHLLTEAHSHGARHAYLQVEGDNHAASAVYRRLGFTDAYAYHYRTLDSSAA